MIHEWKPGDLAVVKIKTFGKTDGFVGVGHGPIYTIPETALMPLADHLPPVDDFFDKPQTNTKDVIESLQNGDIVQVRWQHTDATTITEGTARRTSGGGFRLGSWYFVRDHDPSALTAGATHVRIVKSAGAEPPLPEQPPVGTWVLDRDGDAWEHFEDTLWSGSWYDAEPLTWKDLLSQFGPVRPFIPGGPISYNTLENQ